MAAATRIASTLERLAGERRAGLVPFFSVGDPDLETSRQAILAAVAAGADMIELGVPFSDPIADGPVIQASSGRAIAAGSSLPRVLEMAASLRAETDVPFILFGYYNPFFRYGEEALARDAAAAGVDGILCTDLPPEEGATMVAACRASDVERIFLLAPTSDETRMRAVAAVASGFVYVVAVTGVTGARASAPVGVEDLVARVRQSVPLPVGVGFGISDADQAAQVARYSDLVIVGSALVRRMDEAGRSRAAATAGEFVASLRAGLDRAAAEKS